MKTFHMGAVSGLVGTLAANDPVFAWRKPTGTLCDVYIERIRIKIAATTAPAVTGTGFALQVHKVTAMTANFGGTFTDLSDPASGAAYAVQVTTLDRLRVREVDQIKPSILAAGNVIIATVGTITSAGSPVIQTQPFLTVQGFFSTAPSAIVDGDWSPALSRLMSQTPVDGCFPLLDDEGFIIRAGLAIANSLVIRFAVEVDWFEQ